MSRLLFIAFAASVGLMTVPAVAEPGKPADTLSTITPATVSPEAAPEVRSAPNRAKVRAGIKPPADAGMRLDGEAAQDRPIDTDRRRAEQDKLIAKRNAAWDASMKRTMNGICRGC